MDRISLADIDTDRLGDVLVASILIIVATVLALLLLHFVGRRVLAKVNTLQDVDEDRRRQIVTLARIGLWVLDIALVVSAVLMLLHTFGLNVAPLIASVGVVGLALSLGAQTLIKDLIGGLLIVLENQYSLGDIIEVGDVSGQVEAITLRTTAVRAVDGSLWLVPNGEVRVFGNRTKGWSRAVVDVGVSYEADMDRVLSVLGDVADGFAREPIYAAQVVEPPEVQGPMQLGDWAVTVRVMVKTRPGKQLEIGRELRRRILAACEREGIELPYPRQEVWVRSAGDLKPETDRP